VRLGTWFVVRLVTAVCNEASTERTEVDCAIGEDSDGIAAAEASATRENKVNILRGLGRWKEMYGSYIEDRAIW